ncbi:MAG: HPF/RaiA family ribosome-associated protein [Pseudomonadota bacterium]|nr:HPF/RaiA family ribosome-associated protein [Pseudomonadota bacterium]
MQSIPQVTFRNLPATPALEQTIDNKLRKLEQVYDRIIACRVIVEAPHQHHHKGKIYHIRIDLTVPGTELVVNRNPAAKQAHEDAYVAIRDAFSAMQRQLENYARKQKGQVKYHDAPPHGRIKVLFPEMDYGQIVTPEGRELYFHRNSILGASFDQLAEGAEVRFCEDMGDDGPRASSVRLIGKHHIVA